MQLVKDKNYTELSGDVLCRDIEDIIELMVNYYQSTFKNIDEWLTKQERRFFVACVIISNKNLSYLSNEAIRIFERIFNLRRISDIRGYLRELERKNWLSSSIKNKKINLIEFFKFELDSQFVKFDINLKFNHD